MKAYRRLKFTYNSTTLEIDVPLTSESVKRNEISSVRPTIDGSRYKQITGENTNYVYNFAYCDSDIYDFFNTAHINNENSDVTLQREQDDGTFSSETVIIDKPQYQDDVIGNDGLKVYRNLTIQVFSA